MSVSVFPWVLYVIISLDGETVTAPLYKYAEQAPCVARIVELMQWNRNRSVSYQCHEDRGQEKPA